MEDPEPVIQARSIEASYSSLNWETRNLSLNLFLYDQIIIGEEASALLVITDEYGTLRSPSDTINLYLWMPNMGHGSFPVNLNKIDEGIYKINDIFFTMNGTWDLHLQLLNSDEDVIDEEKWSIIL